jgi:hypothetical protein
MDILSAGRKPEPLHDVDAIRLGGADSDEELLRDLLIRMTALPHLESLTEVLRLALRR